MTISPPPSFRRRRLYDELISSLREDERLIVNGELVKNKIVELALNMDRKFLELLLRNDAIKDEFFSTLDSCFIFDKIKFQNFVTNKQFLPDSYTAFGIKIGLQSNATYLSESDDVVLAWPYKDCVLEGGQTKEDEKRNEIFWNETLAPDEIDVLLEPKVLTSFKKHDKNSEYEIDSISFDDNLIIKGNNLLVLHCLKQRFANKIKLIYIDPPYNTGGDANIFTYNNSFNHSTWLTFMKNRLEVSREMLRKDGFIAIAIDQNELFYLGILADEIFGRENHLGTITVVNNPMGRNQAKYFSTVNDFMLVYAKNRDFAVFNDVVLLETDRNSFDLEDSIGKYKLGPFVRTGGGNANLRENKPRFWYPIFVNQKSKNLSLKRLDATDAEVWPVINNTQERTWKTTLKTTQQRIENGDLVAECDERGKYVIYEKHRIKKGVKVKTVWSDKRYNANHQGIRLLNNIIGGQKFSYPKSLYTVQDVISLLTSGNDIILDFFAGSGTTGHATFALNKEDGGNRKFILVEQLDDHIQICIERNKKVLNLENIDDSFISLELVLNNAKVINEIEHAKSSDILHDIWLKMEESNFLTYRLKPESMRKFATEFKCLSMEEQKQVLISIIDKNQLYVNYSEMDDQDNEISDVDKVLNLQFYGEYK